MLITKSAERRRILSPTLREIFWAAQLPASSALVYRSAMSTELEKHDPYSQALSRLVGALAEDAIFALAGTPRNPREALDGLAKRRTDAYAAVIQGTRVLRMETDFDH